MPSDTQTCPSCGARLPADASVCDLCGTSIPTAADHTSEDTSSEPEHTAQGHTGDASTEPPHRAEPHATAADDAEEPATSDPSAASDPSVPSRPRAASESSGASGAEVYCNRCGWKNPPGARFCSQCGTQLQQLDAPTVVNPSEGGQPPTAVPVGEGLPRGAQAASASDSDEASDAASTRQIGMIVGVAIAAVLGLFFVTAWSQGMSWGGSDTDAAASEASASTSASGGATDLRSLLDERGTLDPQLASRADSLQNQIESTTGQAKLALQQQLKNVYIGGGAYGRAALVQQEITQAVNTPEAWRDAADRLLDWAQDTDDRSASAQIAQEAVAAYNRVIEEQPENLDARTNMALAYMQTNNPMRGVQELNYVLDQDPNHIEARMNKAVALTWIQRFDEAIQQFERVKEIVGEDSPFYQQANQAIRVIQERAPQSSPNAPGPDAS